MTAYLLTVCCKKVWCNVVWSGGKRWPEHFWSAALSRIVECPEAAVPIGQGPARVSARMQGKNTYGKEASMISCDKVRWSMGHDVLQHPSMAQDTAK